MEINTEINKVFGQEMAKLFASQISEEELNRRAKWVWNDLTTDKGWEGPEINKYIKSAFKDNVLEEIKSITETDEFKNECKELAEKLVKEIQEETYKKIVEEASNRMAGASLGYGGYGMRGMVEQIVFEMMGR